MNIKELAEQAGFELSAWKRLCVKLSNGSFVEIEDDIERFAELVAAAEREACAKLIEHKCHDDMTRREEAAAIRARGDKHD